MKSNPTHPLVYIIILNWNGWRDTVECVESVLKITYPSYRILIVDNGSTDESAKILSQKFPNIEILQTGKNLGYAGGNNRAIERALADGAEYVCVLNNDTVMDKDFLQPLIQAMKKDKQIGITSGMIYDYDPPHKVQYTGGYRNFYTGSSYTIGSGTLDKGQFNVLKEVPCSAGAAMLIRADVLHKIGMFDEVLFLYCEELDLSIRAKTAGYKIIYVPQSKLYHKVGKSTSKSFSRANFFNLRNKIWMERKYATKLQYFIFNLYFWCYLLPRIFLGHVVRMRFRLLKVTILAAWKGYIESPW
ncbi:MAG TPA: glycosyltransferase family 2 protein [Candidatus Scalindua sp.]|nr:glycosyltransferase family 2 protein [Candidatus Scalindua sp.]